jgi:hypothetical protein
MKKRGHWFICTWGWGNSKMVWARDQEEATERIIEEEGYRIPHLDDLVFRPQPGSECLNMFLVRFTKEEKLKYWVSVRESPEPIFETEIEARDEEDAENRLWKVMMESEVRNYPMVISIERVG